MISVWKNVVESVRVSSTNYTTLCSRDFSAHPCCSTRPWKKRQPIPLLGPRSAALCALCVGQLMKAARLYWGFTLPHLRPRVSRRPFPHSYTKSHPVEVYAFESSFRAIRGH